MPHAADPRPSRRIPEVLPSHTNHSHPTLQTHPQGARQSKSRSMLEHLCMASCWGLLRHLPRCHLHGSVCLHSQHLLSQTAWPNLDFCCDAGWQRHLMSCCLPQPLDMWRPHATLQFQGAAHSRLGLCAWIEQPMQPLTTSSAHWLSAQPACYLQLRPPAMQRDTASNDMHQSNQGPSATAACQTKPLKSGPLYSHQVSH